MPRHLCASTPVCLDTCAFTPVRTGMRAAISSWKPRSLAVAWIAWPCGVDGVGWILYCSHLPLLPVLCLYIGTSHVGRRQQLLIYASEQVCIAWCRTGACHTEKLTFFHSSSVKVWCAYYTNMCITFELLRYTTCNHQLHNQLHCSSYH